MAGIISEHDEQVAFFDWLNTVGGQYPALRMAFAIPNGGHRHKAVAAKLKAEGVKPGVPDIMLPVRARGKHGLFIEMKAKNGKTSLAQKRWIAVLLAEGYAVQVCFGLAQAVNTVVTYLNLPEHLLMVE